jgi:hypothetical protein
MTYLPIIVRRKCEVCGAVTEHELDGTVDFAAAQRAGWPCAEGHVQTSVLIQAARQLWDSKRKEGR